MNMNGITCLPIRHKLLNYKGKEYRVLSLAETLESKLKNMKDPCFSVMIRTMSSNSTEMFWSTMNCIHNLTVETH
jgi:hypothetical protein